MNGIQTQHAISEAYKNAAHATIEDVLALRIGTVVEAFFEDEELPRRYIIVDRPNSPLPTTYGIRGVPIELWGAAECNGSHPINTSKWKILGLSKIPVFWNTAVTPWPSEISWAAH